MTRILILLFLATRLAGQSDWSFADIPPALLSGADAVVRRHDVSINIKSPEEADIDIYFCAAILSEEGQALARWFEFENKFEHVRQFQCAVYDAGGNLVKKLDNPTSGKAVQEDAYEEYTAKYFDFSDYKPPFSIIFHIKKSLKGFFILPEMAVQRLGCSVQSASCTLVCPPDYDLSWKYTGPETISPIIEQKDGIKRIQWAFANLPVQKVEVFNTCFKDQYRTLFLAPSKISIGQYQHKFGAWKEIGAFFFLLNNNRDVISASLQDEIRRMTEGKSNIEKINILYRYLQQNFRYVSIQIGIGGWQTLDAGLVEKNKYGDCKALSNYMKAMLKYAGIDAQLATIYAGEEGIPPYFDDAPIPKANHMILYIPSEDMWLECTSNLFPAGYLGSFTADRPALLLTPEGGLLKNTPVLQPEDQKEVRRATIKIYENGDAEISLNIHAENYEHEKFRHLTRESPEIQQKALINLLNINVQSFQKINLSASADKPNAQADIEIKVFKFSNASGKRLFVPLNKMHPPIIKLPQQTNRQLPLLIKDGWHRIDTLVFQIPEGFIIENTPPDKTIESPWCRYQMTITKQANTITFTRNFLMRPIQAPPSEYESIRQLLSEIDKAEGAMMVLVKKQ